MLFIFPVLAKTTFYDNPNDFFIYSNPLEIPTNISSGGIVIIQYDTPIVINTSINLDKIKLNYTTWCYNCANKIYLETYDNNSNSINIDFINFNEIDNKSIEKKIDIINKGNYQIKFFVNDNNITNLTFKLEIGKNINIITEYIYYNQTNYKEQTIIEKTKLNALDTIYNFKKYISKVGDISNKIKVYFKDFAYTSQSIVYNNFIFILFIIIVIIFIIFIYYLKIKK